ncbi:hydroxyacylglutathione hydrolase [Orrella sp. JC864]|uniref:hydroxyacylglutathione hydrolase n=1 Tax=Orrella sp. JC864 TaxID=3120298 RepID=UPI003009AB9F
MNTLSDPSGGTGPLRPLPALSDNYIWMASRDGQAIVVDPGQARPVLDALAAHDLRLRAILLTHHHHDHVGGVSELYDRTGAQVFGPAGETLPRCDVPLAEGDRVGIAELGLDLTVLDVPGHTAGHIAYAGSVAGQPVLFCGDTLFAGGCGRLFEGTAAQMFDSLEKFSKLPGNSLVCCAHEYTLANLRWALAVEPGNRPLADWHARAAGLRDRGLPTLPTTLAHERETNPFLRTALATVAQAASRQAGRALPGPVDVFAALRAWKDEFR